MDGFALPAAEFVAGRPWHLTLVTSIVADQAACGVRAGSAIIVTAGRQLAADVHAVIRREDGRHEGGETAGMSWPRAGHNTREIGEDTPLGQMVLSPGIVIAPQHLALCAAAGHRVIAVRQRVRVTIVVLGNGIHRGDGLADSGGSLGPNSPMAAERP